MTLLSDVFHRDKLKKNNINIETKYIQVIFILGNYCMHIYNCILPFSH